MKKGKKKVTQLGERVEKFTSIFPQSVTNFYSCMMKAAWQIF